MIKSVTISLAQEAKKPILFSVMDNYMIEKIYYNEKRAVYKDNRTMNFF